MARVQSEATFDRRVASFVQRNERRLIAAWLAGCVLVLALLAWAVVYGGAERAIEAWDSRWSARVESAAAMKRAAGNDKVELAAVAATLEALDRDFPAQFIKHRLDRERERVLAMLAECYVDTNKKSHAIETLARLVAFDPKHYDNYFRLAEAHRHFGDTDLARAAYEQVLAIHPTHLPTLQALIGMSDFASLYAPVVDDYKRYLDAWLLARVRVSFGERAVELDIPVDGREHVLEGTIEVPGPWSGPVCVETRGYSAKLGSIEVFAPMRVGIAEAIEPKKIEPDAGWESSGGSMTSALELSASTAHSQMCAEAIALSSGAARVRVELTLFKALPSNTWQQVRKAYHNRLELDALRDAEQRSRVGGCLEAGSIFED